MQAHAHTSKPKHKRTCKEKYKGWEKAKKQNNAHLAHLPICLQGWSVGRLLRPSCFLVSSRWSIALCHAGGSETQTKQSKQNKALVAKKNRHNAAIFLNVLWFDFSNALCFLHESQLGFPMEKECHRKTQGQSMETQRTVTRERKRSERGMLEVQKGRKRRVPGCRESATKSQQRTAAQIRQRECVSGVQ